MRASQRFKFISLSITWAWFGIFVLAPIVLIGITSILTQNEISIVSTPLTIQSFYDTLTGGYAPIFLYSLLIAATTTLLCLLIGYPFAFIITRASNRFRPLMLMLLMIPFWVSSLIRAYAMVIMLKAQGLINIALIYLGIIYKPLHLLYTDFAVMSGLLYNLLPFMVLPLYANLAKLDHTLIEAAQDLGATRWQTFKGVILPHSIPGIISGVILVFLPAMTLFYIPEFLGGAKTLLIGNLIQHEFLVIGNWPKGAAASVILMLITLLLLIPYWKSQPKPTRAKS